MDQCAQLARETVEKYVKTGKIAEVPGNLPEGFYARRAGVFVTVYKNKELRGCIGTFLPTRKNIAEEIVSNAVAACSRDYRFSPIAKEELAELNYEVNILSESELIKDLRKHNPEKHGIIVKCADGRCGLLLPDLEGINTTEQQIFIACQKGGINLEIDKFKLYAFTVEKHS